MLSARDAVALCELLNGYGVHYWVMGGWGVDALLSRETRPHKDLDILASLADLPRLRTLFDDRGFAIERVWEESLWLGDEPDRWPSAFVVADAEARALDVHIIELQSDGAIIQHYNNHWPLPHSITGLIARGVIAGEPITCVSTATQIAMHSGYALPEAHLRDLALLRAMRAS